MAAQRPGALWRRALRACPTSNARAAGPFCPPAVALDVVKLACDRPEVVGRSRSQGESAALARQWVHDGVLAAIAPQTVARRLAAHRLTPWRQPLALAPQVPRDAAFAAHVHAMVTLSPRPLGVGAMGLGVDEKTRLQPRTRTAPPWAAHPRRPGRVEHASRRQGALHLCAGFDTRTGTVSAPTASRKRQVECLTFLAHVDRESVPTIPTMHSVRAHVRRHKGQHVPAWWTHPPRLVFHFPPIHGFWMHQVAQRCSMVQRKRLQRADVADQHHLDGRLLAFVTAWNAHAYPFQWSTKSVAQVMATCESPRAKAA